jgi:hypothetical protein
MEAVQNGTLLRALRVQLKRRVPARRGGVYNKVSQAIRKLSRPAPNDCVTPFECELLSERFRKANALRCRVFASHLPSGEVQDEAEARGSTPVSTHDWSKKTAAVAVLIVRSLSGLSALPTCHAARCRSTLCDGGTLY